MQVEKEERIHDFAGIREEGKDRGKERPNLFREGGRKEKVTNT
jgi:hypothetical protein